MAPASRSLTLGRPQAADGLRPPAERSRDLLRRFASPVLHARADGNLESSTAALDAPPPAHIRRQAAGSLIDIHGSVSRSALDGLDRDADC